jgi:hypothetical protein
MGTMVVVMVVVVVDGGGPQSLAAACSSHDEFHDGMKPFQAAMPVHPDDEYMDYSGENKRKRKRKRKKRGSY